jgi:hypothetical protein
MSHGCVYLIYEAGNFRPALDLCVAMKNKYGVAPVLFSPYYLPDTEKYIELSKTEGIPYVHEVTSLGGYADTISQLNAYGIQTSSLTSKVGDSKTKKQGFLSRARNTLASWVLNKQNKEISDWKAYYLSRTEAAANFLATVDAISLILPEDNVERDSSCWCRAIHERGGRATVVSYGSITPHEAAVAYFDNSDYVATTPEERFFLWLYPKWKMVFKKRTMLRLPVARAYAMERMGLAPTRPWVVNTGQVDGIAVESEFMRNLFAQHGVPFNKILPIGTLPMDTLASNINLASNKRQRLIAEQNWDSKKKIILCAIPPNQYPGVQSPEHESYEDLLETWLSILLSASDSFNIIVSPHPSISQKHIDLIDVSGVAVKTDGAAQWLPVCDVYFTSVSSTIKWALACGKPVINYDCYQYCYVDYEGITQVLNAFSKREVTDNMNRLKEPSYFEGIVIHALCSRARYGILDGQSVERIAHILKGVQ